MSYMSDLFRERLSLEILYWFGVLLVLNSCMKESASVSTRVQGTEPNRGGEINLESTHPEVARQRLHAADGFEISLFASEQEFPLHNPVSISFDSKGRLWVATMPSYPHSLPGIEPDDKILIIEDTDRDGRGDSHVVFADKLYLPTGFELGNGGVYVAQQPNLLFLKDTDGDDIADVRDIILHGFGTEDSHHALSAFTWGTDGALYFHEGRFLHSQVETPYGPVRVVDGATFRYHPKTQKLSAYISYHYHNPWGNVFDRWGNHFIADASDGSNYYASPLTGTIEYPRKHPTLKSFTSRVRPTAGAEIISSRHFPEDLQGNFLVNNTIGFQGIKQHKMIRDGSGFRSTEVEPLLYSSDINFRPVDLQFAPDGSLYIVDWFNPVIGHMQYSIRDPNRDKAHGRIWRLSYVRTALGEPKNLDGLSLEELFEGLNSYEDRMRYRVRRKLWEFPNEELIPGIQSWLEGLDPTIEDYERLKLEGLWLYQAADYVEPGLLRGLLSSEDYRIRVAATRVLRHWRDRIDTSFALIREGIHDRHPAVRLEALLILSDIPSTRAAELALEVLNYPIDYYLEYTLKETITTLEPTWKPLVAQGKPFGAGNLKGISYILTTIESEQLVSMYRNEPVYKELLTRAGIEKKYRLEALNWLAGQQNIAVLQVLINAIRNSDRGEDISDLFDLLIDHDPEGLVPYAGQLQDLARTHSSPVIRQASFRALFRISGEMADVWTIASSSAQSLWDFLVSVPHIEDREKLKDLFDILVSTTTEIPSHLVQEVEQNEGIEARYVRIEIPFRKEELSLVEVEVLGPGGDNMAVSGKAVQSSTSEGGFAHLAIDGNRNAVHERGTTSSTTSEKNPWWELDLRGPKTISSVLIWNRKRVQDSKRLNGYNIEFLDNERNIVLSKTDNPAPPAGASSTMRLGRDANSMNIRRAAIRALAFVPGFEEEKLNLFSRKLRDDRFSEQAIAGLKLIPAEYWMLSRIHETANYVVSSLDGEPVVERDSESFKDRLDFLRRLVDFLPEHQQSSLRYEIDRVEPRTVLIRTIAGQMRFDVSEFTVKSGKSVILTFENNDAIPHNLLIARPSSLETVGRMADEMAASPTAYEKQFIPDTPSILYATNLLQAGESEKLGFVAPEVAGDYPFVCTFPGHWRTMNGLMKVGIEDPSS